MRPAQCVKVGRYSPSISHLFFADDTVIFSRTISREIETVMQCIQVYEGTSGQQVNFDKTEVVFSRNVPTNCQNSIRGKIGIKTTNAPLKYLGLPTMIGKSKKSIFSNSLDRVQRKLKGWKALTLSQGAREILIKLIAQALPAYIMRCFTVPNYICHDIKSTISKYWWGGGARIKGKCTGLLGTLYVYQSLKEGWDFALCSNLIKLF